MIPSSVSVLGVEISIRKRRGGKDLENCDGYYDSEQARITLRAGMAAAHERAVLAHEIAHAFVDHSGFGFTLMKLVDNGNLREFLEEQMIRAVIVPYVLQKYRWL